VPERWFEPEELGQMSRPTMDRAIEAIEAGDSELALELCKGCGTSGASSTRGEVHRSR